MACVTLKRSLDFDPLHSPSRPTKRRRCVPLHCTPEKSRQEEVIPAQSQQPSVFRENKLTPAEIAENLRNEMKRLKKRRQFPASPSSMGGRSPPSSSSMGFPLSPSSAPSSPEPMVEAMEGTSAGPSAGGSKEKPIFTLKQMTMIAERMCKERVEQVRLEYDQILQQKLSEQYDAFVKFIDQQIQKRFSESQPASYLS